MENLFEDNLENKCHKCKIVFLNTQDLNDHCYNVHNLLIKFDIEKGSVVMRDVCEYCDETFIEFSALSEHMNSKHEKFHPCTQG